MAGRMQYLANRPVNMKTLTWRCRNTMFRDGPGCSVSGAIGRGLRDDPWECNFVLADAQGREIDVYSYTMDEAGKNIHGVPYAREHLTGTGFIDGYAVRCVPPAWLVKFHTGYKLDRNDFRDLRPLCDLESCFPMSI